MRLSFVLLLAAAVSSLVATGHVLPHEQSTVSKVTAAIPDQSATGGQTSEKRFLRSAGTGSKMLTDDAFKKTKFDEWLADNLSSYTVFMDKLGGKNKYRGLYNEYAALHKAAGKYP